MKLVEKNNKINLNELKKMAGDSFGDLVKAVVDIKKEIMVVDAELHADEEAFLLEHGSKQADLWGINLYPDIKDEGWVEFDSMINLRPSQGNRSRGVEDINIQNKIKSIVDYLVIK